MFEREVIIDRVIAGMERKAAGGRWRGGPHPSGYEPHPNTAVLHVRPGGGPARLDEGVVATGHCRDRSTFMEPAKRTTTRPAV